MPVQETLITRSAKGKGIERGFWAAHGVQVVDGKVTLTHKRLVELCPGSAFRVDCVCDTCGREFSAHAYNITRHGDGQVLCKACRMIDSTKKVYGVANIAQTPGFADRVKATVAARGGYAYAVARYRAACLRKYGVDHPFKSPEVMRHKRHMYAPSSAPQRALCDVLDGKLNFQVSHYLVDVALPGKIAVEYDGSGHDLAVRMGKQTPAQFAANDAARECDLAALGWRLIRVVSTDDVIDVDYVADVVRLLIKVDYPVVVYTPATETIILRNPGDVTGVLINVNELGVG